MKSAARLGVLMFCLLLAFPVRAEEIKTSGRYRYFIENGGAVIAEYNGTGVNLVVPDTLGGKPVVAVGAFAFWQNGSLASVTLPATVISIAPGAFGLCDKLKKIVVPNGVYRFEDGALYDEQNGVLHTLLYACKKEAFDVPDGVRAIGAYAFAKHDELTALALPDSLKSIGDHAFMWCAALGDLTLPGGLSHIGDRAFYFCKNLASIDIPSGVTDIPDYAFFACESLTAATLPDSVARIGAGAFGYCVSLREINLPAGAAVDEYALTGCPLVATD